MNARWIIIAAIVVLLLGGGAVVALRVLSKSESARKALLLPQVQSALERLQERLAARGVQTFIGSTRRSEDEQAAKYAAGLSATTKSWHLLGRALELYAVVDGEPDTSGKREDLIRIIHDEAPHEGFRGIAYNADGTKHYIKNASGKPVWDANHLEYPEGMTWAQAAAEQARVA